MMVAATARQSGPHLPGDDGRHAAHRADRRHVAEVSRPATFRRGSAFDRPAKWAPCARPWTAWPTPWPSAKPQLKQAVRQQVTRAEKLASIGRLAAGVAHEINNPLTGVLTFAHLLREKPNMDAQDQQDLDLIIHETTRAADIVRGLLDFARERPHLDGGTRPATTWSAARCG